MVHVAPDYEDVIEAFNGFNALAENEHGSLFLDSGYEYRIVRSTYQLAEKTFIREAGLDDRVVEICKLILLDMLDEQGIAIPNYDEFIFAGKSDDEQSYVALFIGGDGDESGASMPVETYDAVLATGFIAPDMPKEPCIIDAAWAKKVLDSSGINDGDGLRVPDTNHQGKLDGDIRITEIMDWPFRYPREYSILTTLPDDEPGIVPLGFSNEGTSALIIVKPLSKSLVMPFRKPEKLVSEIHKALYENQGLVEVGNGHTLWSGCDYIYSIVKSKLENKVEYILSLHIKRDGYVLSIQGYFDEEGTTGIRDTVVYEMKRREGMVSLSDEGIDGWNQDPYDESRTEGFLMNLSETRDYDSMFPDHPLSQLRKALKILTDYN